MGLCNDKEEISVLYTSASSKKSPVVLYGDYFQPETRTLINMLELGSTY